MVGGTLGRTLGIVNPCLEIAGSEQWPIQVVEGCVDFQMGRPSYVIQARQSINNPSDACSYIRWRSSQDNALALVSDPQRTLLPRRPLRPQRQRCALVWSIHCIWILVVLFSEACVFCGLVSSMLFFIVVVALVRVWFAPPFLVWFKSSPAVPCWLICFILGTICLFLFALLRSSVLYVSFGKLAALGPIGEGE